MIPDEIESGAIFLIDCDVVGSPLGLCVIESVVALCWLIIGKMVSEGDAIAISTYVKIDAIHAYLFFECQFYFGLGYC